MKHDTSNRPAIDDPEIVEAMKVYDNLNDAERREIFRNLCRSVTAFSRTSRIDYLMEFAKSVRGMMILESKHPEVRDKIRNAPRTADEAGGAVDFSEVYRLLRE